LFSHIYLAMKNKIISTVTIDIISDKAVKLLKELELLKLIRVRKEKVQPKLNWAERYKGAMSKQSLTDVDKQLNELRTGWE
jgi:hypothetical protein